VRVRRGDRVVVVRVFGDGWMQVVNVSESSGETQEGVCPFAVIHSHFS
jgi:hypothetical protein